MLKRFYPLILILTLLFPAGFAKSQMLNDEVYKFIKTIDLVNSFYVDTVNRGELVDHAIIEVLKQLDPHSVFISKEEVNEMNEPLEGSFNGVGIQFNILADTIWVVSTIAGGPSEKVGIRAGDRLVTIDQQNVAGIGIKNKDVFSKLRGKKGTKVNIVVKRQVTKELLDFVVTRDKIPIYSIDASYMVSSNTGYIKLSRFAATTMNEYREQVKKLKDSKAENLILDLTGNGGGYLNIAVDLADEFLDGDKLVVYTEGSKKARENFSSSRLGNFEKGKVVIMVDEGSASASEIVSGAIQDWDRGLLVGRRSFGKGLVQRQFAFNDGSMMRLTVARYYTPTGRCIQKPYDGGVENYHKDLEKRYKHGEFSNLDSIQFPDSLLYYTLTSKRTVFGGGGIMPDIFVPIDTSYFSPYLQKLTRKGLIYNFMMEYTDKNRQELERRFKGNFNNYLTGFSVDDAMLAQLVEYAKKEKVEPDSSGLAQSKEYISVYMKGLVARNLWTSNEYFQIVNSLDPIYKRALDVILSDSYFKLISTKK